MLMPSQIITLTLISMYSSNVSWRDYVMSVLGDLVGVLCGSWLFDDIFKFFFKVESQSLLMRLGLRGAPH